MSICDRRVVSCEQASKQAKLKAAHAVPTVPTYRTAPRPKSSPTTQQQDDPKSSQVSAARPTPRYLEHAWHATPWVSTRDGSIPASRSLACVQCTDRAAEFGAQPVFPDCALRFRPWGRATARAGGRKHGGLRMRSEARDWCSNFVAWRGLFEFGFT